MNLPVLYRNTPSLGLPRLRPVAYLNFEINGFKCNMATHINQLTRARVKSNIRMLFTGKINTVLKQGAYVEIIS